MPNSITPAMCRAITADIDAALKSVAAKHSLDSIKCGRGSYTSSTFTVKVECVLAGGLNADAHRYEQCRAGFGWPPLGSTFAVNGKVFTINGCNTTGSKFKVTDANGKSWLYPADVATKLVAAK